MLFKCQTVLFDPYIGYFQSGLSEPGSDGNEEVLHIPQSSKIGALPSDGLLSYPGHSLDGVGVLLLCKDTVGVFYNSSWLGYFNIWVEICELPYMHTVFICVILKIILRQKIKVEIQT